MSDAAITVKDINPIIETPRLRLTRLTDTNEGSQHLQWFHEYWSDPEVTFRSLRGHTKTMEESRTWMIDHRTKFDSILYAVHTKVPNPSSSGEGLKEYVGMVGLRKQDQPVLPPPAPPSGSEDKPINLRAIGYAFFASSWGQGYATEANAALVDAYKKYRSQFPKEQSYIEAGVDSDNPGSIGVLRKLGFHVVGEKMEEPIFFAGEWRDRYWIYGLYV